MLILWLSELKSIWDLTVISRNKKYVCKRADSRNQDMWKKSKNLRKLPAYEHGYIDAMNQILGFIEYLETPPPKKD